jgi:ATP phosphoribosyltransferase regulatory subunit
MTDIPGELKEVINNAPFLRGKFELLHSLSGLLKYKDISLLLEEITETCKILDNYGLGDYFTIDFSLTGDLSYYSGYIFEFYTKDMNLFLGSGGRYDNLLGKFGYNCPASGFSINIGKTIKALEKHQSITMGGTPDFFITRAGSSIITLFKIARELRRKGFLVEVEVTNRTLEESLGYARNRDIKSVIILGSAELQEKQILLKNMETGDETVIDFDEFLL